MITTGARTFRHMRYLAEEIGCRMIATPVYQAAVDYITHLLTDCGCTPQIQSFDFPCWAAETVHLELSGKPLEAVINAFSPTCQVSAATIPIGTLAELETADLTGRIPLLYGHLAREPLVTKDAFYANESDHHAVQVLEEKQPLAIITIHPRVHDRWPLIEDPQFMIPSITVSSFTGLELLSAAGQNVQLEIHTRRLPGKARNLIAGMVSPGQPRIVLCAHYDTKVNTPGACDNASGAAVLLTLAERWTESGFTPPVEMVFFGGEEYSMAVDQAYINQFEKPAKSIRAAVNLDGIGHALKTTTVAIFEVPPELEQATHQVIRNFPGVIQTEPWPASDHSWFYPHGIPTWAISQEGLLNLDFAHSPDDNLSWISPDKLEEAVNLTDSLIQRLV